MARALADALYDRLIDAFPSGRAHPYAAFEESPMPPSVAHFLRARLNRRLGREVERLRAARSAWFDYDHAEVQAAGRAFRAALKQHAQVPPDAWGSELREATRQVTAYLIRPVRTLVRYAFEEEDGERSVAHLLRRMDAFAAYPYLREAISAYARERNLEAIDRTHLTALLTRVDRRMAAGYDAGDWERLLDPLFVLADAAFPDRRGVPAGALEAFFAAKDAAELQHRLGAETSTNSVVHVDRAALRRLLGAGEESVQRPPASDAPAGEAPGSAEETASPRWRQFRRGETAAPPAAAPPPAAERASAAEGDRPLWQQFRPEEANRAKAAATAAAADAEETPDSLEALEQEVFGERGARNRAFFVRHLFDGSEQAYTQALRRLRPASTWSEASRIIAAEVFRRHQVNIYSDPAATFTDAVEARFRD